jgi:hypothetical protein
VNSHPNLSNDINKNIAESEMFGGYWLHKPEWATKAGEGPLLEAGKALRVITLNTDYLIENRPDGTYISGNAKYCPSPVKCSIHGSTWGGSMLKVGWIGLGMHLEFSIGDKTVVTSEIQAIGPA